MAESISRRSLLKASGIAAATAAFAASGISRAFADEAEEAEEAEVVETEEAEESDDTEWEGEYDVIVVGAGLAGLVAAITVADADDGSTCLLLEKGSTASGMTPYSEGRILYTDNVDAMATYLKAMCDGTTPDDVLETFAEYMGNVESWLFDHGAQEEWLTYKLPGTEEAFSEDRKPEYPEFEGSYSVGVIQMQQTEDGEGYSHVMLFAQDLVEQHSDVITYLTETPCEDLIQDADTKEILGVVANGVNYRANKGVIMCLGGFEDNEDMMKQYLNPAGAETFGGPNNTGDGFDMCAKVGAKMWHMNGVAGFYNHYRTLDGESFISDNGLKTKQYGITVGVNGRRFYQDWDAITSNAQEYEDGYDYLTDPSTHIGYRHGITQFGGEWTVLPMPSQSWFICDADNIALAIPEEYSTDVVADGYALQADTIEELAEAMDVPSDELVDTVEFWNECCEEGKDKAFYRAASSLVPISTSPFYAIRCSPAMLNTFGGPERTAKGEIMGADGEPIPHLYSAGEFGSVWSRYYQGCGAISECIQFGIIAANSALEN